MPTVFNAANEIAVRAFLEERIGFLDIAGSIRYAMDRHHRIEAPGVEDILSVQRETIERLKRVRKL